jgi:hypothetical protein
MIDRIEQQLSATLFRELADNGHATLRSLRALSDKPDVDLPPLMASLKSTVDRIGQTADGAARAIRAAGLAKLGDSIGNDRVLPAGQRTCRAKKMTAGWQTKSSAEIIPPAMRDAAAQTDSRA